MIWYTVNTNLALGVATQPNKLHIKEITEKLNSAIDNKEITCGLFLDFSKAFDIYRY